MPILITFSPFFGFVTTEDFSLFFYNNLVPIDPGAVYMSVFASFALFYFIQISHKNIFEIPNLIHTSNFQFETFKESDENYLLFLSRIHPKKGLDILVEAMSKIDDKKIKLKVVGHENEYSNELKRKCVSLQIEDRVEFLGGVFGDEKYSLFKNARAFVLPSYTEAIGMVNLEAAICETPVLTTFNTGIKPEWSKHGGLMINPNVEELIKGLNEITNWTALEISDRGRMLKNYVITDYSWENKGYL